MKKIMLFVILIVFAVSNLSAPWTISGSDIYNNNTGNVGIGTSSPGEKLIGGKWPSFCTHICGRLDIIF